MKKKKLSSKLKVLLLLILWIWLPTQMLYSENETQLQNALDKNYGIDLNRNYTGQEVQELINIVIQEAEKFINESYNAGYKQGVLAYKPDVEYWKTKALGFERQLKKQKRDAWLWGLSGVSIGFLGGIGLSFGIRLSF